MNKLMISMTAMVAAGAVQAAAWNYTGRGNWTTAANWSPNVVPSSSALVTNNVGGTIVINSGDELTVRAMRIGAASGKSGKVEMTGGSLTLTDIESMRLGAVANGSGEFLMTGGALAVKQAQIGASGNGTFVLEGGRVTSTDYSCIGRYSGGVGKMVIRGTGEWYCSKLTTFVGEEGAGELVIENGGKMTFAPDNTTSFISPNKSTGRGTTWLKTGGTLSVKELVIQKNGLFVLDGGALTASAGTSSFIGNKGEFQITENGGTIDNGAADRDVWIGLDAYPGSKGGTIVKKGSGKLTLHYPGTYLGGYHVQEGTLVIPYSFALAGYATAPMTVAAGAKLSLGATWTDAQVLALTNRATFVLAEGATFERAAHNAAADIQVSSASGYTVRIAAGTVFDTRLVKTGAGTLIIEGPCQFKGGVCVTNGYLEADYETSGLKDTHVVLHGTSASAPAYLRVRGETFTAPLGTSGATLELNAFCGVVPGSGPLTVNYFGDGRLLKSKTNGFNFTDYIVNDQASWPVQLKNSVDLNGNGNFTLKCQNSSTGYFDGTVTNSTGNAVFNHWDGNLVFRKTGTTGPDFSCYTFTPRSGNITMENRVIRMSKDFAAGAGDSTSGKVVMKLKDCDKSSSGGWDYVNGTTGTVMVIDGGTYKKSDRLNVGYTINGKTGELVITNNAQVSISTLCQYSGTIRMSSGKLTQGNVSLGYHDENKYDGTGFCRFLMTGGEIYGNDGCNFQIGNYGKALFWMTGGSVNCAAYPCVGRYLGAQGEFRLHGGSFYHRKNAGDTNFLFFLSEDGTGLMSIANGGTFETEAIGIKISSTSTSQGTLILSPGGTMKVSRVAGAGGTLGDGFVMNGGRYVLRTGNQNTDFIHSNLDRTVVTPYGGTIDTNGKGDFSTSKAMTAATNATDLSETMVRHWTFTGGSLVDSASGQTAALTGDASSFEQLEGTLRLKGAAQGKGCVKLGTDLIPADGRGLSIEVWFTPTKRTDWARLFDFGRANNEIYLAHHGPSGKVQFTINGLNSVIGDLVMTVNHRYYVAVTVGADMDNVWEMRYELYDGETGEKLESKTSRKAGFSFANIAKSAKEKGCWLGYSSYTADKDPAVDYHDVRIHHRVMTPAQIAESARLGADRIYALTKAGAGTLTLTGANTYRCGTEVAQGMIALADGATLPATEWVVANGATLKLNGTAQTASMIVGSGTVCNGTVAVTGTIQPGGIGTVGTLTLDGTAVTSGALVIDIGSEGESDCLSVTGALDLSKLTLKLGDVSNLDRRRTYTIVTAATLTGAFASCDLPRRWQADIVGNTVKLSRINGLAVVIR